MRKKYFKINLYKGQLQMSDEIESKSNISNNRNSLNSEVKTEELNISMRKNQPNNNNTLDSSSFKSESKNPVNIVESHKETDNVPYFLTESVSGTNLRLPPLDPYPSKLRGTPKLDNPIRSVSNRTKKINEDHISI